MKIAKGTYTGDGLDTRVIASTGIDPDLLIITGTHVTNGNYDSVMSIRGMGDAAKSLDENAEAFVSDRIQALGTGAFTIGTDVEVNASGVTYYWMAFEDDGDGDFEIGSYSGDGNDNRNIALTMAGTPAMAWVMGDYVAGAFWRTDELAGDLSQWFNNTAGPVSNGIQSLGAGVFQVGTRDQVNRGTDTPTYWYAAFVESAEFKIVEHTGTGSGSVNITGAGFDPDFSIVQRQSNQTMVIRTDNMAAGSSEGVSGTVLADGITAHITDGITVATGATINLNVGSAVYTVLFFKTTVASPSSTAGSLVNSSRLKSLVGGGLV
jgi:hypothetical protein